MLYGFVTFMYNEKFMFYYLNKQVTKKVFLLFAALVLTILFVGCTKPKKFEQYQTLAVRKDVRKTDVVEKEITTINGDKVKFNINTRKIVALSNVGDLLAFGIKPMAVNFDETVAAKYKDHFKDVKFLKNTTPFSEEEILSYGPELIFVYQRMEKEDIEKLSKIAPVVPLLREEFDFEKRLSYISDIFGLEEIKNELVKYSKDVKQGAIKEVEKLNISSKKVTLFYYFMENLAVPPTDFWYFNKIIYEYMGFERTNYVANYLKDPSLLPFANISNESLPNFDADFIMYVSLMGETKIPDALSENPAWKNLKSVKENKVAILDGNLYAEKDILFLFAQYDGVVYALKTIFKK